MSSSRRARQLLDSVRPTPAAAHIGQLYAQVAGRQHVVGCFVGHKTIGGRRTKRRSLVCLVTRKRPPAQLRGHGQVIPPIVIWNDISGRGHRFPTDVVESTGRVRPHVAFAGPGDDVQTAEQVAESVGVALEHGTVGDVVTTGARALASASGITGYAPG